ncbi:MAG: S8 family serine peptidase [Planctomycetota bacterium]
MKHRDVLIGAWSLVLLAGGATAQGVVGTPQAGADVSFRLGAADTRVRVVGERADGATMVERVVVSRDGRVLDRVPLALLAEFLVEVEARSDAEAIARGVGAEFVRTMTVGGRAFEVMRCGSGEEASRACDALAGVVGVRSASTLVEGVRAPMRVAGAPFGDPRFAEQWHHENVGQSGGTTGEDANMLAAWNAGYSGVGSTILIVDNGVQTDHPDLAARFSFAGSWDIDQNIADPNPKYLNDRHGTACAGIAAADDDGTNTVGAAYNAEISGWRVDFPSSNDADFAQAFEFRLDVNEITNNSYGPRDSSLFVAPVSAIELAAIDNSIANGRGGLGSVHVKSAGNGLAFDDDSNFDGLASSRYFIAVSATDHDGRQSGYSEPGANILVNAPSSGDGVGTVTSDVEGVPVVGDGYTPGDFTTTQFGGTSSAGPLVAGVVALMLEANPGLTWRDVQYVLATTAERNDPSDADWTLNGAGYWVNHKYGFGRVDAGAAVGAAEVWAGVPATVTESYTFGVTTPVEIPDDGVGDAVITLEVVGSQIDELEFVEFTIDLEHSWRGDVEITLTSPDGTPSRVESRENDSGDGYLYTFSSRRHLGEGADGVWTLRFVDTFPEADAGRVLGASIRLTGLPGALPLCAGDFDGDGDVDLGDFGVFGGAFGSAEGDAAYDGRAEFDTDGDVDLGDFGVFGGEFGRSGC